MEEAARESGDDGDDGSAAAIAGVILLLFLFLFLLPLLDVRCARGVESCISSPISSAKEYAKRRRKRENDCSFSQSEEKK